MKDLIQELKQQIKDKKAELAKLEKALGALEGEKPAPKAKTAAPTRSASGSAATGTGASSAEPLPDRIMKHLQDFDDVAADNLAQTLGAPLGQVRTTCSRLAREGRISVRKLGKTALYSGLKSEADNPFEGAN